MYWHIPLQLAFRLSFADSITRWSRRNRLGIAWRSVHTAEKKTRQHCITAQRLCSAVQRPLPQQQQKRSYFSPISRRHSNGYSSPRCVGVSPIVCVGTMFSEKQLTIEQLDKKAPLADSTLLALLNQEEKNGVLAMLNMFEPQRKVFKNILRLFFTVAGFSWFFVFFPSLLNLPPEQVILFRVNQYQIYLILLTLWGFELKMQEKRLSFLLNLASTLGKKWYQMTEHDIQQAGKMQLFNVFYMRFRGKKNIHIYFIWLLMALTIAQFVRQTFVLFQ